MMTASDDIGVEKPSNKFPVKEYDVTDVGCQMLEILTFPFHFLPFVPGFVGKKILILDEEEAYLQVTTNGCCDINTRRPYGELGSVDRINCCGCHGIKSGLVVCLFPGCGGRREQVDEVLRELKMRMKDRGDTGQIRRTEQALEEIRVLRAEMGNLKNDIHSVLKALNVSPAPATLQTMDRTVE